MSNPAEEEYSAIKVDAAVMEKEDAAKERASQPIKRTPDRKGG